MGVWIVSVLFLGVPNTFFDKNSCHFLEWTVFKISLSKKQVSGVGGLAALAKKDSWQARPRLTIAYHIVFVSFTYSNATFEYLKETKIM